MTLLSRLISRTGRPSAAVEIAPDRVSAMRLAAGAGPGSMAAHASEELPDAALAPGLATPNVLDRAALADAVARVLSAVGSPRRIGLLVPDPVAKVSFVHLDHLPDRREDLDRLIRWQIRKTVPFGPEEAQVSWTPATSSAAGHDFVVAAAQRGIVREYEEVCIAAGAQPETVDLSTFNLANALLAGRNPPIGDWLLVAISRGYASLGLLRDGDLLFFRTRAVESADAVPDLVYQTAMYYEDRLQGRGLARAIVAAPARRPGAGVEGAGPRIAAQLPGTVEVLDLGDAGTLGVVGVEREVSVTLLPLWGLLRRERSAA